ncbi:hypothetical protein QUF84_20815 [Fictibacillus enclensis]|uniref:Uncharacterized protein n=1 Tax=Fictibacillus enclensis TaxID=1017270 RepID=A0A0V8J9D4_9BACL|nr:MULTISPECIES: hypothetical protein [Fictibacillus]KSU83448.1 hypothetical protein AS030_12865 [Fictibacillus enclensis]MDM5200317.1 hypothetical protein [Fictibacillus enclensis]MDM5339645.1 hypothetical protein [Fictibacillus enclensis]RXZ02267.1 hypothetical protein DMO16_22975 [Fictibacillus sp. S7]WHY71100.1 hypothetical protein QNH15_19040 [Fictibacillus enclensis]
MIRFENGIYRSVLQGNTVEIVYKGANVCEIYLNNVYEGIAPFDYVRQKLYQQEKKRRLAAAYYKHYEYKEFVPIIDVSI